MRKPKFSVGQVFALRGYEKYDPDQYGIVRSVLSDAEGKALYDVLVSLQGYMRYYEGELRPLTAREIGPRPNRRAQ